MVDKILVALDYSKNNKYDVFYSAVVLAQSTGASLMLLHVLAEEPSPVLPSYFCYRAIDDRNYGSSQKFEDDRQQEINFLQKKAEEAKTVGVNTEFVRARGNPSQVICELAKDWSADLVVVGTQEKGLKETFLSRVSNYVTHHAPCSVLIVRTVDSSGDRPTMVDDPDRELTLDRYLLFSNRKGDLPMLNKILVAIDRSDRFVFDSAISLAQTTGASILLLHILSEGNPDYPVLPTYAYYSVLQNSNDGIDREEFAKYEHQGIDFLQNLTQQTMEAGVNAEYSQLRGNPQQTICELASNWSADLIVVGSRGLKGLKEMFLGSVSNYVTHHAPCSVLIVRPRERRGDRLESATNQPNNVA